MMGGPFARKIPRTAVGSSALAPSPYTVSVGNATSRPARRNSAARRDGVGLGSVGLTVDDLGIHDILVSVSHGPETYGTLSAYTAPPSEERFSHGRPTREFDRDTNADGGPAAHRAG